MLPWPDDLSGALSWLELGGRCKRIRASSVSCDHHFSGSRMNAVQYFLLLMVYWWGTYVWQYLWLVICVTNIFF